MAAFSWCDFLSAAIYARHISFNETVQCLLERACEWSPFSAFFPFLSLSFCFFLLSTIHTQTYLVNKVLLQQNILVHFKGLNDALAHVKRNFYFSLFSLWCFVAIVTKSFSWFIGTFTLSSNQTSARQISTMLLTFCDIP